ncbi:phosphatidate cytidylyltransferase [Radiobacillus kanasensis]|uniref:phosphatidate cytidylyltransferase n=1 Tax=Radiobacillus kanasensis TaxID=2844358 RepID=UPI001E28C77F|nr:phosphatidate cytidylyltransferase [Radiobacillus kanasensis]UFU01197.1 phosphatidate cytidylyltransferase [Radiobacillus kanasensis]
MLERHITLIIIFCVLLIVNLVFYIMMKNSRNDHGTLSQRMKTWWGMFFIFCIAILFNPLVTIISLMVLCFFSLKEYFSMIKTRKGDRRIFLWAYLAIPIQFYWIAIGWYGMFIVFIPVYVFLLLPIPRLIGKGTVGFLRSVSSTQWGIMLMVFGLSHLAYYQIASPTHGSNLVLFLIVLTQVNDVVHHLVSVYLGKKKIIPSANPHVTWEGFLGGLLVTTLVSFGLYTYLTPFTPLFGVLSGVIISVAGFFGMLTISVLRRDLLIEDTVKLENRKGSYLTRIDSLAYTSPIFFHIIRYYFDFM